MLDGSDQGFVMLVKVIVVLGRFTPISPANTDYINWMANPNPNH